MSLKHALAATTLALASALASAQQAPTKPAQLPSDTSTNWALVATLVFGASFYFYVECLSGNCRPVPCWMTATCKT